ncbi:MAG: DUF2586 family protein [Bacteroidales bacterium]|jgi:hypothetical protein|nr:DUF2586 family protein [Bacteroidales bacterium]
MALPSVKISFENGSLGSVVPSAEGVVGLVCTGVAVAGTGMLELGKPYILRKIDDLVALGVTSSPTDNNSFLYRHVKEFYDEAGEGAELWLMCFPNTDKQSDLVDKTKEKAKKLIGDSNGRIRTLGVAFNPVHDYNPTISKGVDEDLFVSMLNAQMLGEWSTNTLYSPVIIMLEARQFNETVTDLEDLSTYSYNRVGVMLGDSIKGSKGSGMGLVLGRISRIPVQRHIGRVRDGGLKILNAYIANKQVEYSDIETINDKGYITMRVFAGKSGYFFNDDNLSTAVSDDYRSIARRRTIDKAYRIAYTTLLEYLHDEIPITSTGGLVPAIAKSWESEVEQAIVTQMTAEGNLGVDTTDPKDKGVKCYIDYEQNIVSTGKLEISLKVKPYGYAKYIDVKLGFITIES